MSDPDVAAVLAEALAGFLYPSHVDPRDLPVIAARSLAALTAANIVCVYVPEGAVVGHGARLVVPERPTWYRPVYAIEPPSEAP